MGRHRSDGPSDSPGDPSDELPDEGNYRDDGDYPAEYTNYLEIGRQASASQPTTSGRKSRRGHRGNIDWRGGHRSEGGRRGVSIGVIAALVTVVVVVAGVILWRFFGDALSHRSDTAAGRCVAGDQPVAVIADPAIADQVQEFADQFNGSGRPVGDHCMKVTVKPAGSDAVVSGFIGDWPKELGDRPALWVPGSSVSAARLQAATGRETISDSRSLVTSPVVLAIRPELKPALDKQNWALLPGLQNSPNALAGVNMPGWGSLRLALPISGNSDASFLAVEAVAAASAPAGAPASAGIGAVHALVSGQPKLADNSVAEAMNALLGPGDPATGPVHAVVITEQQLVQRGASLPDAAGALSYWLPPGPVAMADYPAVLLRGSWLSQDQVTAASEFARFMRKPGQTAQLAKAGFRAEGVEPPSSVVTDFPALPATLSVGDEAMRAMLADALTTPMTAPAAAIMLDQSMTTQEGGKTRLANVIAALDNRIQALPANSVLGLWTFDGTQGRSLVPFGPLADPVNGQPRAAALSAGLDGLSSTSGGAVSFTTAPLVYNDVLANYAEGQNNSVLVITDGPHTDRTLDGAGLKDFISRTAEPERPVAVNVIDFGGDPDRGTWEAVAQLSGGSYQNLPSSTSPELATALDTLLS